MQAANKTFGPYTFLEFPVALFFGVWLTRGWFWLFGGPRDSNIFAPTGSHRSPSRTALSDNPPRECGWDEFVSFTLSSIHKRAFFLCDETGTMVTTTFHAVLLHAHNNTMYKTFSTDNEAWVSTLIAAGRHIPQLARILAWAFITNEMTAQEFQAVKARCLKWRWVIEVNR